MRLVAEPDAHLWSSMVAARGREARRLQKAAVRTLMARTGMGATSGRGRLGEWAAGRLALALLQRGDGSMLAWAWREDPGLLIAVAHAQEATAQVRVARAMAPIDFDDTEEFSSPFLGEGERLRVDEPASGGSLATATYTWDTGSHLIVLSAMCTVPHRFGALEADVDDLARSLRADEVRDLPGA